MISPRGQTPLVIAEQGSFFVGGRCVTSDYLSLSPGFAAVGAVTVDQIYVRYQIPPQTAGNCPLVFVHGSYMTGKCWETTPDGRMGWDEFFVRRGFAVYVIDQSWRGRSGGDLSVINAVRSGKASGAALPELLSCGQEAAWITFRFGSEYPIAFPGQQFPVEAVGEFWKQMVPDWFMALPTPNPTVPALSELALRLGCCVLVCHSQSGLYPFQTAGLS